MDKILLIEDHLELRENTAELLELSNYVVLKAEDGKEGVELALRERPDLVICDIMMPVLDGYGVLHTLQQHPETSGIPIIFLTARSNKEDIRRGMEQGADDYLTKPFDGIELLRAVESCLKKKLRFGRGPVPSHPGAAIPADTADITDLVLDLANRDRSDYREQQMIYAEGQRPVQVFYIATGKTKTYRVHPDGKELITHISGPGEFLGYSAMLDGINYQDNSQALEDAELVSIGHKEFWQLITGNPEIARQFIRLLGRDLAEKELGLLDLAYSSLRKKVAGRLLQVLDKYRDEQGHPGAIGISRENLAHFTGSATESLTRTLSAFKEEKLIEIREGRIYVLNETKLRNLVN
jgi:CRP/FNR family transcriptional regulator, cyclic AMP receptor protein